MTAEAGDAVILCGGLGTRLRSVLSDRPKPMADVGGKPFLERLIDWAVGQGVRRFILCVGHQARAIKDHFRGFSAAAIEFSEEAEPLGTGGALKLCEPLCRKDLTLVLNGDSFCPIDLSRLEKFHRRHGGAATVAAVPGGERSDGGALSIDARGAITAFQEKAPSQGKLINAGIYAFDRRIFELIPAGKACSLEREILPGLIGTGLSAYTEDRPLYDIGTPERLELFRRLNKQA